MDAYPVARMLHLTLENAKTENQCLHYIALDQKLKSGSVT